MGGILNAYFDENFNADNLKSMYTRGNFDFGGPLAGYNNVRTPLYSEIIVR